MVKLRLARAGAKRRPFYRLVATDERNPRDGRFIEQLGTYDPNKDPAEVRIDLERWKHWLNNGAQPTATVGQLVKKHLKEEQASS